MKILKSLTKIVLPFFAAALVAGCVSGTQGERVAVTDDNIASITGKWDGMLTSTGVQSGKVWVNTPIFFAFNAGGKGDFTSALGGGDLTWRLGDDGNLLVDAGNGERTYVLSQDKGVYYLQTSYDKMVRGNPHVREIRITKVNPAS